MRQLSLNLCAWSLCSATREWKLLSRVQLFATPWTNTVPGILQARTLSLLQGIFPTQGSNPNLPHCRWILYQLSHQESPRILEWVAYPFYRGSSQPVNRTRVSCIAGRFFTNRAMREAFSYLKYYFTSIKMLKYLILNNYPSDFLKEINLYEGHSEFVLF